jgi:asparagine synthase (glutamine-hydrolysing)
MAFSLEARSPFLNHELIELTAKMPSYLKIKFFKKKYIFKKLLANKHLLPKEIIQREKRGFVAPIDSWLKQEFKSFVLDNLESKKFKEANIFNQKKLEVYLQNYHQGREINSNNIFALLALASWIQKYF